jgi:pyruvate kinase
VDHPRPTRAEASDVANAIFDGTDAVMLSAETAVGNYPVETVRLMGRIIESAEEEMAASPTPQERRAAASWRMSVSDAICEAAARAAEGLSAGAIAVFTQTGNTARKIARHRPDRRVLAFTTDAHVLRRMMLYWGIEPRLMPSIATTDTMIAWVAKALMAENVVRAGDRIVVTAGTPVGRAGSTNFLKVHKVP